MGMKGDAEWWREKGKQVAAELRIFADFLEHQRLPTDTCGALLGKYTIVQNGVSVTVDYDSVQSAAERLEAQIAAMELGVIRCKDCRHPDPEKLSDDGRPYCWKTGWYICDEFYCFMAEPKAVKPSE